MDVDDLEEIGLIPNRSFYPSAFEPHSIRSSSAAAVCSLSERPNFRSPERLTPYAAFPNTAPGANTPVTFGCQFKNSCNSCKAPPNSVFQQNVMNHNGNGNANGSSADKQQDTVGFTMAAIHCSEFPGRVQDLTMYQGFTGPYTRIPGYIDMPVVQRVITRDDRHEHSFPVECYQPWNWSNSWSSQVYCSKEQTQSSQVWRSSQTENAAPSRPNCSPFIRRVRKKRVPYTKLQLKELEHEYNITKFITKERRRRIASCTNLSERQVTIWFQNRRVKDKKNVSKVSTDYEPYQ